MVNLTGNKNHRNKKRSIKNLGRKDTTSIESEVYVPYVVSRLWTKSTHSALNTLLNKEREADGTMKRKKSIRKPDCVLLAGAMSLLCRGNVPVRSITSISAS